MCWTLKVACERAASIVRRGCASAASAAVIAKSALSFITI
jgi:hypothetical protein